MKILDLQRRIEKFMGLAKEHGVKLTPQRLEIFCEVSSNSNHPNAEVLYQSIKKRMPTVSLDTVYRTLWMLSDLGVISTINHSHSGICFDANVQQHHHYICTHCGTTKDFECVALNDLPIPKAVEEFGSISMSRIEVRGLCVRCAKDKAGKLVSNKGKRPQRKKGPQ
jgi:Fur family peroxide stress response transcriptional regulator